MTDIPPLPGYDGLKRELATRSGWEGRWHRVEVTWVEHGEIGVLISFPKDGGKAVEENYEALRDRWPEFIEGAVAAVQDLIAEYDHEEYGPDPFRHRHGRRAGYIKPASSNGSRPNLPRYSS